MQSNIDDRAPQTETETTTTQDADRADEMQSAEGYGEELNTSGNDSNTTSSSPEGGGEGGPRPLSPYFFLVPINLLSSNSDSNILFYSNFKLNANPRSLISEYGGRIPPMSPTPTTSYTTYDERN
ncbi:hypothetical protein EVAR_65848_1 [Eumeta japonica]|uniref:Uncharacterized protein n=1 Tax=Eumeta variegata TaxID=151549 RepID=A0A4C2A361_EUMVA|nr:hypothetical protein EVAR_65848_1 [Eumeta japonica]